MASLERLLTLINFSHHDHLWLVGDLVNRGPRSLDVLRWVREHEASVTCVLGNHDLHFLARAAGAASGKKRDTLDGLLAAPDCDRLADWLRHRPLVHIDRSYLMVHAGLHPQWTADLARRLGGEIEHELRGPGWRAFLAQIGVRGESDLDAASCELFILDDDRPDRPVTHAIPVRLRLVHAASCAALSAGNDSATRKPGSVL
jgi:hypothetical protein